MDELEEKVIETTQLALEFMSHRDRKTLSIDDLNLALKHLYRPLPKTREHEVIWRDPMDFRWHVRA